MTSAHSSLPIVLPVLLYCVDLSATYALHSKNEFGSDQTVFRCVNQPAEEAVCMSGLCYDMINTTDDNVRTGCATPSICAQAECVLGGEGTLFTCCCANPYCNGKSHKFVKARWKMFAAGDYKLGHPIKVMNPRNVEIPEYTPPSVAPASTRPPPTVASSRSSANSRASKAGPSDKNPMSTPLTTTSIPMSVKVTTYGTGDGFTKRMQDNQRPMNITASSTATTRKVFPGHGKARKRTSTSKPPIKASGSNRPAEVKGAKSKTKTTVVANPPRLYAITTPRLSSAVASTRTTPMPPKPPPTTSESASTLTLKTAVPPYITAESAPTSNASILSSPDNPAITAPTLVPLPTEADTDPPPMFTVNGERTTLTDVASGTRTSRSLRDYTTSTQESPKVSTAITGKANKGSSQTAVGERTTRSPTDQSASVGTPRPKPLGKEHEAVTSTFPWYWLVLAGFASASIIFALACSCFKKYDMCARCIKRGEAGELTRQAFSSKRPPSQRSNQQRYCRVIEKNGTSSLLKMSNGATDDSLVSRTTAITTVSPPPSSHQTAPRKNHKLPQKRLSTWWKRKESREDSDISGLEELTVIDPLLNRRWNGTLSKPDVGGGKGKH